MKVLVTGSSGRVGSAVVKALLEKGYSVRGFDLCASGLGQDGYDEVTGSLDDALAVQNAVIDIDAVLHLGAFMSWTPQDKAKMFSANVEGTRLLADAASEAGAKRFVFSSSGEVYPENAPVSLPVTESHPLNANSPYGLTKLLGEEIIRFHQRAGKMETVILRFSHTQDATELLDENSFFSGPRFFLRPRIKQQQNFNNHSVADILQSLDPGEPAHILARNEDGRPYQMHITDARDMVDGVVLALESKAAAGEVFNLGATDPVDFEALLKSMSEITGLPIIVADLPGAGVYYQTSNEKIRKNLGYQPKWTIDRMIKEAAEARRKRQLA
jgi:UDP-glucose 4-epimerase